MPHSIIEDLYYGRRGTSETIEINETYKKILDEIIAKEKILTKDFSKEQKNIFYNYCDLQGCLESEHSLASYIEGFKIGFRVAIECLEQKND